MEGSLRLGTMIEIAREFQLDVPYDNIDSLRTMVQIEDGDPFTHDNFLSKFQTLRKFYQSPEVIQRMAREVVADAAEDNIRYIEIRFTPVALTRVRDFPMREAIDWVVEATNQAAKDYGIKTQLIASVNRHESLELAEEAIGLAVDRRDDGIVGIDLAGDEAKAPGEQFGALFMEAKKEGMHVTVHAGEWGGAENVIEAIDLLGAERIGHGVRVMEDASAVEMAIERNIPFEVCVTSNYQSGVTPTLQEHPLPDMHKAGLDVTINTDDPSLSQIDLSDEFELAAEDLNFTPKMLEECILCAAKTAFLEEGERAELVKKMEMEFNNNAGD